MTYISDYANISCKKVLQRTREEEMLLRDSYEVRKSVKNADNKEIKKKNYYRLVNGIPKDGAQEGWRENEWMEESGYFLLDYDSHNREDSRKLWRTFKPHINDWGIVHAELSARGGIHLTCIRTEGLTIEDNILLVELKSGYRFDHIHDLARACFLVPNDHVFYQSPLYYQNTVPQPLPLSEEDRERLAGYKEEQRVAREREIEARRETAPEVRFNGTEDEQLQLKLVIDTITQQGIDITSDYMDWIDIGFSIANIMGSAGEPLYHQVSQFYPGYSPRETSTKYRELLSSTRGEVHLGTLIWIAQNYGAIR